MKQLNNVKLFAESFKGQDLHGQDLSNSVFTACDFDDADLTDANCEHTDFTGSRMRHTKCTRTNFKDAKLAVIFHPSDCLGMTLTLNCKTFMGMKISKQWWYGWLYFAMEMAPELDKSSDLRDKLRALIGVERFFRMKEMFRSRQL
jgi:hypothetical protein